MHLPDLSDQTIVVTGANSGVGLETTAALAGAGATVVMACRNLDKAKAAMSEIESRGVTGTLELLQLDLADQRQIRDAAEEALDRFARIDRLINNAGVMAIPFSRTVDGFETVFGTNHLGHFAFTGLVLPRLLETPASRVVTVGSMSYRIARIRWDDLDGVRSYSRSRAYSQSKLANMLFAFELQRRLAAAHVETISLVAHPGFAASEIGSGVINRLPGIERMRAAAERFIGPLAEAAMPSVRAATDPAAYGGQHYGPGGFGGIKGPPVPGPVAKRALDEEAQSRLWALSVELTGVEYAL